LLLVFDQCLNRV